MIKLGVLAVLATAAVAPAGAATITTLFNTGVDASGAAIADNAVDAHWVLASASPTYAGAVNGQFPIGPWLANTATSRWISPLPNAGTYPFDSVSDGVYTYSETFSLAGYQAATASFTGQFASDNTVDSIKLNGTTLAGSGGSFTSYQSFDSAGATFNAGLNTLTFVVRNFASTNSNPTGLRVEVTGSAAVVPEPALWAMMVVGFGLVGAATRRRVRTVAA